LKTPNLVGIRFKPSHPVYFLDALGISFKIKDKVVVRLEKGKDIAKVVHIPTEDEKDIELTKKWQIIRKVTVDDLEKIDNNKKREKEAFAICESKIKKLKLPMKLLRVEFTFDESHIMFYFKAVGKIDFRQLVRQLAAVFKTRIEMRQVGARDETELLGGLGVCGRVLCCSYWNCRDIKWCRENKGNKAKLVGVCNRTLCCLKFESQELDSKHLAIMKQKELENRKKIDKLIDKELGENEDCSSNCQNKGCQKEDEK